MTENELLAMMKKITPISNGGTPAKLAMRSARQNNLIVSFYGEKDPNEWGEEYRVTMTADEARTIAGWLLRCANELETPISEMRKTAA